MHHHTLDFTIAHLSKVIPHPHPHPSSPSSSSSHPWDQSYEPYLVDDAFVDELEHSTSVHTSRTYSVGRSTWVPDSYLLLIGMPVPWWLSVPTPRRSHSVPIHPTTSILPTKAWSTPPYQLPIKQTSHRDTDGKT